MAKTKDLLKGRAKKYAKLAQKAQEKIERMDKVREAAKKIASRD